MKKIVYFASAVLLVLSSCINEINEESFVDKTNTISFNAYAYKTRATNYVNGDIYNSDAMKEGQFGVVGYTANDNRLYLGSISKAIAQEWNNSNSTWEYVIPTELKYWPSSSMNFYAYFPYSESGDVFALSDASGDVMTINNESGNQDVLFAFKHEVLRGEIVPLRFNHAFSKIKSLTIQVNAEYVEVEVSKVEFLNTSTKGKIKVNNAGNASYETTNNDEPRSFDWTTHPKVITKDDTGGVELFGNDANGYVFATNTDLAHNVVGTGKTMWNGDKAILLEGTLSESDFICMKLTCKVNAANHYLVGSESDYGTVYIPMCGTRDNSENISELLAGRRYIYKVIMSGNVGYDDNGDPIQLSPIRFAVNEVADWDDAIVTITL